MGERADTRGRCTCGLSVDRRHAGTRRRVLRLGLPVVVVVLHLKHGRSPPPPCIGSWSRPERRRVDRRHAGTRRRGLRLGLSVVVVALHQKLGRSPSPPCIGRKTRPESTGI
jgi:hypothetical protein